MRPDEGPRPPARFVSAPEAVMIGRRRGRRTRGCPIHVDRATQAEVEALPGVGRVIARRIIAERPYRSADDLGRVKGIGGKRLEEIRPPVTAERVAARPATAGGVGAQRGILGGL